MIALHGDQNLSNLLKDCSKQELWKEKGYTSKVSTGWQWSGRNRQVHYIRRDASPVIMGFLMAKGITLMMRSATIKDDIPLDEFEEWNPPGNQEAAITYGYLDAPLDYKFILPYYHFNAYGAWRAFAPEI